MSLNESADTSFFDGREFSSFEELSHDISEYEKRFFVNLYVRGELFKANLPRRWCCPTRFVTCMYNHS